MYVGLVGSVGFDKENYICGCKMQGIGYKVIRHYYSFGTLSVPTEVIPYCRNTSFQDCLQAIEMTLHL